MLDQSGRPAGSAWFPTNEADKILFPLSLAPSVPPPGAPKRSLTSPVKREDVKRQRMSPAPLINGLASDANGTGALSLTVPAGLTQNGASGSTTPGIPPPVKREAQPPPPVPAQVTVTGPRGQPPANGARPAGAPAGQQPMRVPPAIRPPPAPTTAVGGSAANGGGLPPPSPVKPTAMQRSPLQTSIARIGEQSGQPQLPSKEQKQASTELLARLQARQGQLAGAPPAGGLGLTPQQQQQLGSAQQTQPQLPQQPPVPQQQRPGMPAPQPAYNPAQQGQQPPRPPMQHPSGKPFVWQGEVSWTVHSAGPKGGGNVLGCQVVGYAAHQVALEELCVFSESAVPSGLPDADPDRTPCYILQPSQHVA